MEAKKSPHADLESKRTFFLEVGIIVAIATMLVAFEWKSYNVKEIIIEKGYDLPEDVEKIPITQQKKAELPIPVPAQTTLLNIVENEMAVDDDLVIDAEDNSLKPISDYIRPTPIADEPEDEEPPFIVVEDNPEFPGGESARIKFLLDNINYPQVAREAGIQGTVYLTFVIEKNGSITDVRILRGVGGGCDEEAIRVVNSMPKWNPGKQRGKPVRVQFNMPIKFTLASS